MTYDEFLNFLDKFEEIPSFAGRIRIANENLTRLGSGSGRAVYDIDGEKVFKVAKNPKGKAQNDEEVNVSTYDYNHDIVTKVLEYDNQNNGDWIVSEKAKKVGEKRIKELTGIPSLLSLGWYLKEFVDLNRGKKAYFGVDEKDREILDENEWVHELKRLVADHEQEVGDMGRPSTYGEVLRNGKPTIVLSDYGLSDEVYQTHYAPKKSGYNIYELVDMNRGEIYQEFTDGEEIRKSWWGFQPYNPPDGDPAFVNENFVKFVEARENFMIRRPIFNLMSLAEEFHGAMNGIQEYVNKANNQKKFFKNLVNLQEYLIEQGVYNREQLLFEEDPPVVSWSLERKEADELATLIAEKVNLPTPKYLDEGGYGQAYRVGNQVLKITSDVSEADAGMKIKFYNPKTIVEIYNIWKIVNNKTNRSYYALLEEYIADKPVQKFSEYMNIFLQSMKKLSEKTGIDHSKLYYKMNKRNFDYDKYIKLINDVLFTENDLGYSDQQKQDSYKFMVGLGDIKKDLLDSDILKGSDYLTLKNLGYKDGVLKFFDVGGYRATEPVLPDQNILRLNEEKYSQEMTNKIVKKIGKKFTFNKLEYLGTGLSGDAYDIGNDVVLKITADRSEMIESLHLKGKKLKHIADIYTVYEVKSTTNTSSPIYVIMLEKLDTNNNEINSKLNRLKYVFSSIFGLYLWDVIDSFALKDSDLYEGNKTQIENYFKKNTQDSDFFFDLSELVKEIDDNNIESSDYRNGENLGYKKDGSIGFFDIGFGDPYQKSHLNPKQLDIGEDGSAKFSTDNSIGRDDFPAYNNKDTSPSIENDLNANSAMYTENVQQMEKLYVKTGKFNEQDKKNVLEITGGDNYTKRIADFYDVLMGISNPNMTKNSEEQYQKYYKKALIKSYNELKNYNKNIIPIKDFDNLHPLTQWSALDDREEIINSIRKLPSVFIRNLKPEIRKEREAEYELHYDLIKTFQKINGNLDMINGLSDDKKNTIYKKIFSSKNITFKQIADQLEKTEVLFLNHNDDIEGIRDSVKYEEETGEAKILHDDGDILVVDVKSSDAMKTLGCGSQWCFATEYSTEHWGTYADSSHVNVIYNFKLPSDARDRMVVILPDGGVYDMYNDQIEDGYGYLVEIGAANYINVGHEAMVNESVSVSSFTNADYQNIDNDEIVSQSRNIQKIVDKLKRKEYLTWDDADDMVMTRNFIRFNKNKFESFLGFNKLENYSNIITKILQKFNYLREDLEYNHVDDATKDEFKLSEKRIKSYMPKSKTVTVKKKCRLGGLGNTSVACNQGDISNLEFGSVNEKERIKSYMPKSKTVTVKKKCRLGGLGNTSVACNQGDINNLEFGSIKEEIVLDSSFVDGWNRYTINNDDVEVGEMEVSNRDKYIILNKIAIHTDQRQKGYADETLKILFDYANKNSKIIALTPDDVWGVNKEKLKRWYKSLGFVMNTGRNKDFQIRELMIKKPVGEENNPIENQTISESELMQLQDLPFKNDVEGLGGKIFSVGGAVRDEFLGKESKDLDILITGIPMEKLEAMLQQYGKVDAVGESFGVLKFKPQGGGEIDVAIPRTETATGEGGHKGFDVTSDHTLPIEKDLERRDFTINAIAKDIDGNLIDPFNGQEDLKNKIIRIVNPEAFSDDPLRMLRAVQFASRFGFTIEPKTMEMIKANAGRINEIPPERILIEFDKIIKKGDILTGVKLLQDTGLFKNIFGFDLTINSNDFNGIKTMGEFIYLLTKSMSNPAEHYRNNLKGDIDTHKEIRALDLGMNGASESSINNRSIAHNMYLLSPKSLESKILPEKLQQAATELLSGRFPKTVGELAVNGNDLMQLGLQGKEIGDKLKSLLINVYAENIRNDKEDLLSLVSKQNPQNLSESKYSDTKKSLSMSKSISKDMKEKIEKYLNGGSSYHEGGRLHGLKKPKIKGKQFNGVGLGADKNGFYVYTHRARSKSKESPDKIPQKDIDFIESTG